MHTLVLMFHVMTLTIPSVIWYMPHIRGVEMEDEDDRDLQLAALSDTEIELQDHRNSSTFWGQSSNSIKASVVRYIHACTDILHLYYSK